MSESLIYTIDDDVDFNMVLKMALKPFDVIVKTHSSPEEFVKSVKGKLPDLCILDLNLDPRSGGEGFQLLKAMRNVIGKELPIFIMSKRGEKDDVLKAMDMGANDFIPKPLDDRYLLQKLRTYLPKNGLLQDVDNVYSKVSEKDKTAEIITNFKLVRISFEELEIESEILLSKEMNLYFEGDALEMIFENRRMNFKVIESSNTESGKCRAKLERELSDDEFFALRRWLTRKKVEALSQMKNESTEEVEQS